MMHKIEQKESDSSSPFLGHNKKEQLLSKFAYVFIHNSNIDWR